MGSAIVRAVRARSFDVCIIIAAHRRGIEKCRDDALRNFAIVVISRAKLNNHVLVLRIVAETVDEAAPGNVLARKRLQIDGTAIFDIDRFGISPR